MSWTINSIQQPSTIVAIICFCTSDIICFCITWKYDAISRPFSPRLRRRVVFSKSNYCLFNMTIVFNVYDEWRCIFLPRLRRRVMFSKSIYCLFNMTIAFSIQLLSSMYMTSGNVYFHHSSQYCKVSLKLCITEYLQERHSSRIS